MRLDPPAITSLVLPERSAMHLAIQRLRARREALAVQRLELQPRARRVRVVR